MQSIRKHTHIHTYIPSLIHIQRHALKHTYHFALVFFLMFFTCKLSALHSAHSQSMEHVTHTPCCAAQFSGRRGRVNFEMLLLRFIIILVKLASLLHIIFILSILFAFVIALLFCLSVLISFNFECTFIYIHRIFYQINIRVFLCMRFLEFAFHVDVATAYKIIADTFSEKEICELAEIQLFPPQKMVNIVQKGSPLRKVITYG